MTTASPISNRRDATRERLRDAARATFVREGMGAVSIDRLCEAAGFSRGAFYSNYSTKHELALDLLARQQGEEIAFWNEAILASSDLEATFAVLEERFNAVVFTPGWGLLNMELQLEAQRNVAFGERYRTHMAALYARVRDLVQQLCIAAGTAAPDDIDDVAMAIRCLTVGLTLHATHDALPAFQNPGRMMLLYMRGVIARAQQQVP